MSADTKPDEKPGAMTFTEEAPVTTEHSIPGLEFVATTGRMPIKNDQGEILAQVFYVAYTKKGADAGTRPVTFTFNGGPGSPSIWLHMGAVGPFRTPMMPEGQLPPAPYKLEPNLETWLHFSDLVFIDPVGTGYSRAKDKETAETYWGVEGDIKSVSEFCRMWLNRNARWRSPLYLVGESYGTTRAAGMAGHMIDQGIALNGVILVSAILNFQTGYQQYGNDISFQLYFPTYTATAYYHDQLPWATSLDEALRQSEAFVMGDYARALQKGDDLVGDERQAVVNEFARLTGLSADYVDRADLRVTQGAFCKELLREKRRTVGRLDSRIIGIDDYRRGEGETMASDPSMSMLMPPYTATFHDYVRTQLKYESDLKYEIFGGIGAWDWGNKGRQGYPDTSEALRNAMHKNPYMKVFVASGYYDLATPYFATEYTYRHMGLDPEVRTNVSFGYYEAGHMMYVHTGYLTKLFQDVKGFVEQTQGG